MPKFRKKPVVIEAVPIADIVRDFNSEEDARRWWPAWITSGFVSTSLIVHTSDDTTGPGKGLVDGLVIQTMEGTMFGASGSWLIRGVKGELYPCAPDIFEATYEAVRDPAAESAYASRAQSLQDGQPLIGGFDSAPECSQDHELAIYEGNAVHVLGRRKVVDVDMAVVVKLNRAGQCDGLPFPVKAAELNKTPAP